MSGMAALMVLVACPAGTGHCISEPVRVVSYETVSQCEDSMSKEIKRVSLHGMKIYGSCNSFDARLLKGLERINRTLDIASLKPPMDIGHDTGDSVGFASRRLLKN